MKGDKCDTGEQPAGCRHQGPQPRSSNLRVCHHRTMCFNRIQHELCVHFSVICRGRELSKRSVGQIRPVSDYTAVDAQRIRPLCRRLRAPLPIRPSAEHSPSDISRFWLPAPPPVSHKSMMRTVPTEHGSTNVDILQAVVNSNRPSESGRNGQICPGSIVGRE